MKNQFRLGGVILAIVIGLLSGGGCPCPNFFTPLTSVKLPVWSQSHADVANSGQSLVGAPAKASNVIVAQIGIIWSSSAVLGPDGSVYIGTKAGELVRLSGTSAAVLQKVPLGGVISTPAVDKDSNVYIAQMTTDKSGAHLLSFSSDLRPGFDVALPNAISVSSPKILSLPSGSLIFEAYTAAFGSLLIVNEKGHKLMDDQTMCSVLAQPGGVGAINIGEDPAVGIRKVNGQHFLVLASNFCAIQFYTVQVGSTSTSVQLTRFAAADNDAENDKTYSDPAVSPDGTVLINDSDKNVTAYDITTGNQKWQNQVSGDLWTTPVLVPLVNKGYALSSERLTKIDIASGQVDKEIPVAGAVLASPAAAGQFIFVSTTSGLSTYDLDLNLPPLESTGLAGGFSSPAIGPNGQVYVGATDGHFFLFPGL